MQPWVTEHLAWYLDAIGTMLDLLWVLVMDIGIDDGTTPTVGTLLNGELVTDGYQPGYGSAFNPQIASVGYGFLGRTFLRASLERAQLLLQLRNSRLHVFALRRQGTLALRSGCSEFLRLLLQSHGRFSLFAGRRKRLRGFRRFRFTLEPLFERTHFKK